MKTFRQFYAERNGLPVGVWHHPFEAISPAMERIADTVADYIEYAISEKLK